jgi:hypothetical protein
MDKITVVVLADPTEPQLAMLEALPPDTAIAVGNQAEAFERAAPQASIIFNWSGSGALLREVLAMCPTVRWVHCRAAGLDDLLSSELVDHPVPLTNGSGVFSPPLGRVRSGSYLILREGFPPFDPQSGGGYLGAVRRYRSGRPDRRNRRLWRHRTRRRDAPESHGNKYPGVPAFSPDCSGSAGEQVLRAGGPRGDDSAMRLRSGDGAADARDARHDRCARVRRHEAERR